MKALWVVAIAVSKRIAVTARRRIMLAAMISQIQM
jgi:hypothetical protein